MNIIPLKRNKYKEWDDFCLNSDDCWFWHTIDWLEYNKHYKPKLKSKSLSFFVNDDRGILAICPLLMEEIISDGRLIKNITFGGSYGPIPALRNGLSIKRKERILKFIFTHIDKLANKHEISKILMKFTPITKNFIEAEFLPYNFLMKFNFYNTSLNTQIISLLKSEKDLWNDIRKGHKYDINRGGKVFEVNIFNKENMKKEIFNQYVFLHHKTSGRITRPLITFEMMYKWIIDGNGILCGLKYKDKYVGFALVSIYKKAAYYGSASDDPDIKINIPLSHIIQWEIIKWLKANEYKYYEIGWQVFSEQYNNKPTEKEISISSFKRGFGGYTVPLFLGIKNFVENE